MWYEFHIDVPVRCNRCRCGRIPYRINDREKIVASDFTPSSAISHPTEGPKTGVKDDNSDK